MNSLRTCLASVSGKFLACLVQRCLSFHNSVLNFHNSNSKPITHNSNSTITQKIQHFCLVTKLSHVTQFLTSLFAKIMDPPIDTTQQNMVATRVPFFFFCSSNPATPKPSSTTTNGKPRNPQPQPPPPTTLNTTTTSTKKIRMNQKSKPTNSP